MVIARIIEDAFPNETAAARLHQVGLFTLIWMMEGEKEPVTAAKLSAMTGPRTRRSSATCRSSLRAGSSSERRYPTGKGAVVRINSRSSTRPRRSGLSRRSRRQPLNLEVWSVARAKLVPAKAGAKRARHFRYCSAGTALPAFAGPTHCSVHLDSLSLAPRAAQPRTSPLFRRHCRILTSSFSSWCARPCLRDCLRMDCLLA